MPIIKRAAKKLRHDRKRTHVTMNVRKNVATIVKTARKSPSNKSLQNAYTALDKAAKRGVIHKNKASRLKSRLAKLLKKK